MRSGTSALLFCILLIALSASGSGAEIVEADLASVELLTGYIDSGPDFALQKLSSDSPLRSQPAGMVELLLGPVDDSFWEIDRAGGSERLRFSVRSASGLTDLVTLIPVRESDGWKIHDIVRLSVDRSELATPLITSEKEDAEDDHMKPLIIGISIAVAVVAALGAIGTRSVLRVGLILISVVGAFSAGAFALRSTPAESPVAVPPDQVDVKALLELRHDLESSGDLDVEKYRPLTTVSRTAALWVAQSLYLRSREKELESVLSHFALDSPDPLAHWIKARTAERNGRSAEAIRNYEKAVKRLPDSDTLRLEAAQACLRNDLRDRGIAHLRQLESRGSFNPHPYYLLSLFDVLGHDMADAEQHFLRGMQLEPMSRDSLLSVSLLWQLARRDFVAGAVNLFETSERSWGFERRASRALRLRDGWESLRSGEALLLKYGSVRLVLWGFASGSPEEDRQVDPKTWERLDEIDLLSEPERLTKLSSQQEAWLNPSSRERLSEAVRALEERSDWGRVRDLTKYLPQALELIPTDVIIARGLALKSLELTKEAETFAASAAIAELKRKNPDAERLYELGELMVQLQRYDVAIKLFDRVESIHDGIDLGDRIRQLWMTQRLGSDYQLHQTEHFELRIPKNSSLSQAKRIGGILEFELARIQERLGITLFERCEVNLLSWNDFKSVYTKSNHVLGFYDGAITVPLADVPVFPPQIVAILTHELTHAVIAQATRGRAPRWFQEGMAGRMEMLPGRNPYNKFLEQKIIPVNVLESVLRGSPDPELVGQAYLLSELLIRYLEAKHGSEAGVTLMQYFSTGMTTDEALEMLAARSLDELDVALREWGRVTPRTLPMDQFISYQDRRSGGWIRLSSEDQQ